MSPVASFHLSFRDTLRPLPREPSGFLYRSFIIPPSNFSDPCMSPSRVGITLKPNWDYGAECHDNASRSQFIVLPAVWHLECHLLKKLLESRSHLVAMVKKSQESTHMQKLGLTGPAVCCALPGGNSFTLSSRGTTLKNVLHTTHNSLTRSSCCDKFSGSNSQGRSDGS